MSDKTTDDEILKTLAEDFDCMHRRFDEMQQMIRELTERLTRINSRMEGLLEETKAFREGEGETLQ